MDKESNIKRKGTKRIVLDQAQLDSIKVFIRKRGFTQTDLQYEILDHVASLVEDKMNAQPELSFDAAVTLAHQDFGILGFSTVEDAMRKSLEKQYWNQVKAEFYSWIRFPSVFLVVGFGFLLYLASQMFPAVWMVSGVMISYLLAYLFLFLRAKKASNKYRYTLTSQASIAYTVIVPNMLFQLFFHLANYFDLIESHERLTSGFAVAFALLTLVCVFCFWATRRVLRYTLSRCREAEARYGSLAD